MECKAKKELESVNLAPTKHRSKKHHGEIEAARANQSQLADAAQEAEFAQVVVDSTKSKDSHVPPQNAPQDTDIGKAACTQASSRVLFDNYFQLAQTGSLATISLRAKTARDSAKSIALGAAGGVTSVDETTTSPLKAWTEVLKAIAGAL